ncbi:hypothetical protein C1H46_023138 [Malus baccata]|uniref:Uncharacterized protein n=1 Tax=Malus baccata TaxID=106549 RepID=A0A540LXM6_MALBA|nr:hypothetical protein C1H46_023138 [Malus baccata]
MDTPFPISSLFRSLAMYPIEIMCRVLVFTPSRVFPTTPPSLCCLPLRSTVSLKGFHKIHLDSWLLSFSFHRIRVGKCDQ